MGVRSGGNEIMWSAARPAGGRLYVRGTEPYRAAGGVHQPCRMPRQSWGCLPGLVVGVAPVAVCFRARRRARSSTTSRDRQAGRVAGQLGPCTCTCVVCLPAGVWWYLSGSRTRWSGRAREMRFMYRTTAGRTWRHVELQ